MRDFTHKQGGWNQGQRFQGQPEQTEGQGAGQGQLRQRPERHDENLGRERRQRQKERPVEQFVKKLESSADSSLEKASAEQTRGSDRVSEELEVARSKSEEETKQGQQPKSKRVQRAQGLSARSINQGQPVQPTSSEQRGQDLQSIYQGQDQSLVQPHEERKNIQRRAGAPRGAQGPQQGQSQGPYGKSQQGDQTQQRGYGQAEGKLGAQGQLGPQTSNIKGQ